MTAPVLASIPNGYGVYLFGPLGRLMPIQVPLEGFSNPVTEFGVLHQPLSGATTKDVFGYKQSFQIPLDALDGPAWSFFEMIFRGAIPGPYYLMDPRRRNRLSATVSANDTVYTADTVWFPSSGALPHVAVTSFLLPDKASGRNVQGPGSALSWTPTAAGTLLAEANPIPVLAGETITFSCYVQAGNPTLELVPYDSTGTAHAPWTGTVDETGLVDRKHITRRIPLDGSIAAVRPQLRASAAGTYTTLGWQVSDHAGPEPWVLGAGVPQVLVDGLANQGGSGGADYLGGTLTGTLTIYEV
ncbi:MAG TPA: hypothetical protein VGH72_33975 [Pseudonocardia sp.]|jgi:hypothetical protein